MIYRALENLGGTQKRQRKNEVENETATRTNAKFPEHVHTNAAAVSNYHKTSGKTKLSHGLIL